MLGHGKSNTNSEVDIVQPMTVEIVLVYQGAQRFEMLLEGKVNYVSSIAQSGG